MFGTCNIDVPNPCETNPLILLSLKLATANPIIFAQHPTVAAPAASPLKFKIIDIELNGFLKRFASLGYKLTISQDAKEFISEKGYDPQFGARPLKRAIQKYLENEIAELIISSRLLPGDNIFVDFDKENSKITTKIAHITDGEEKE